LHLLWWRPPCLLRQVIVNLKDDASTALRGVLFAARGAWLVLVDVSLLKAGAAPARVDGEVVIHRTNVAFIQVLP
jgi:small nuclear ribonucleoprotein (snRNP)-like protein